MYRFLLFVAALFVMFFACTQNQTEQNDTNTTTTVSSSEDAPVVPQSIEPQEPPPLPNIKRVPQAPKSDLIYPKDFIADGIPHYDNSTVENNIMLDNDEGKYGKRVKLSVPGNYDEVTTFYADQLVKNGWSINNNMNKTVEEEGIRFFRTNYVKGDFTLGLSIMDPGTGSVAVTLIRKEN